VSEFYLPKCKFSIFLIFETDYFFFLHKIIFNIFVTRFLMSFVCLFQLRKMFNMSSFFLHASPKALSPWVTALSTILWSIDAYTPDFIPLTLCSPNSPDLNPADYKVWSVVQEQVYHTPILDVNDLKQRLLDVWAAVDKRIIYYFVNVHFGRWSSNTRIFLSIA